MTVNLLFGLPKNSVDFSWFFALKGIHVVCGGSTAQKVATFLQKKLTLSLTYVNPDLPPVSSIHGVDLVTEGIVTMSCVLDKFKAGASVSDSQDGASLIHKLLLDAKAVNFFVGLVENPKNRLFPQLKSKAEIVESIASILQDLGKKVTVREV